MCRGLSTDTVFFCNICVTGLTILSVMLIASYPIQCGNFVAVAADVALAPRIPEINQMHH